MIPDGNSAHQSAVAHTKTALRNALSRNTDCVKWLESGAGLNQSGFDQVWSKITVGPYTFVGGQPTAVTGSPLSPGDNIAINAGGLFFGGSGLVAIGVNGIYANTDSGREFILLHEMAHVYGASGFNQNDGGSNNTKAQTDNNNLIMKNCGSIFSAGTA